MKHSKLVNKQPFFARFLEAQQEEITEAEGGTGEVNTSVGSVTIAWKDGITAPAKDGYHTMKYPSDGDDTV